MGCSSRIQQIVGMGKSKAALHIKSSGDAALLNAMLDRILTHEVSINDSESLDWIRWLMAGGKTPENFSAIVKKYNNASVCGHVWKASSVAYRCRTCSLARCMSMCAQCFLNGNHVGHDYNMFRSQTGGGCDCGDANVMKSTGFCRSHGLNEESKNLAPPPDLLRVAEMMAPRLFFRLILHLRNLADFNLPSLGNSGEMNVGADDFLAMLCELSDMGAAMMRVLTSALTSPEVYRKLTQEWTRDDSTQAAYMAVSTHSYECTLQCWRNPEPPAGFENCLALQPDLRHTTFLEELIFWAVVLEFPQKLINFLLVMLPEPEYKVALTKAFALHYSRVAMVIEQSSAQNIAETRACKICVQLFSIKELAVTMVEDLSLLHVMVVCLKRILDAALVPATVPTTACESIPLTINLEDPIVTQFRYWLNISDLNTVFSHEEIAMKFMNDEVLVKTWISLMSYFQGVNVNRRELDIHIEVESESVHVFMVELSINSLISSLSTHLKDASTAYLTKRLLSHCLQALETWLQSADSSMIIEDQFSFHLPLHRLVGTLISHAVNVQHVELSEVMPPSSIILQMLPHPLRIQAMLHEIINDMWPKNGLQIKKQAVAYTQTDFCDSTMDIDLFLMQIFGNKLPPNEFIKATMKEFKVNEWLRRICQFDKDDVSKNETKKDSAIQSFLEFWGILCTNRMNLGNTPAENVRNELVTLLCKADRTHSHLNQSMPDKSGPGQGPEFDLILNEVATHKPPIFKFGGNMQQGLYAPKEHVWTELYDPMHVLLRTRLDRKDVQNTTDRFVDHLQRSKQLPSARNLWSPYRIPVVCKAFPDPRHILNGRVFHALVWLILYQYVHRGNVPDNVLSLTVYLLELVLCVAAKESETDDQGPLEPIVVTNENLEDWFVSDNLTENVRMVVRKVDQISDSSSETNTSKVDESIITLLNKCYCKLGGRDSVFDVENSDVSAFLDNRIGDGAAFVQKTVIRIALLGEKCRETTMKCLTSNAPSKLENILLDKAEQKRRAEERRRQLMASFAAQRNQFAKNNESELTEDKMDWNVSEASGNELNNESDEKYYCGICRKMLTSTKDNPIVLLTQVQPTCVLGHRKSPDGVSLAQQQREELTLLTKEFFDWSDSVTFGREDGVYVQSCGHVFDLDCLAFLQEPEFPCPVCRQRSNNMIPILPSDATVKTTEIESIKDLTQACADISRRLQQTYDSADSGDDVLERVVNKSLATTRNCLSAAKLARFDMEPQSPCTLLFLISLVRCNLELELLLRGDALTKPEEGDRLPVTKKPCMLSLLVMVGECARKLNQKVALKLWRQLLGSPPASDEKSPDRSHRKCRMPILLRDPIAILLHLTLSLPIDFLHAYFDWIVKILYILVNFQAALRLSHPLSDRQKTSRPSRRELSHDLQEWCYETVIKTSVRMWDIAVGKESSRQRVSQKTVLGFAEVCLPFLRIASILRSHLLEIQLPLIQNASEEQVILLEYLELANVDSLMGSPCIDTWFTEFGRFATNNQRSLTVARTLLCGNTGMGVLWRRPKLIPLPYEYKDIFQNYQSKTCTVCQQTCEKMSMCLICQALVCLGGNCCRRDSVYEGVRHASSCGSETGIFLTISSSNVIVIRGLKSCIWGSVYLDTHGEEDPDLSRGKPLYLSSERYQLLENEWLSHSFNRNGDFWKLHKDRL